MKNCMCYGSELNDFDTVCPVCGVAVETTVNTSTNTVQVDDNFSAYQNAAYISGEAMKEEKPKRPGSLIAALILSILGLLTSCVGIGGILGIISIILAVMAKKNQETKDSMSTAAMILGIAGTALSALGIVGVLLAAIFAPNYVKYTAKVNAATDVSTAQEISIAIQTALCNEGIYEDVYNYGCMDNTYHVDEAEYYLPYSFTNEVENSLGESLKDITVKSTGNGAKGFSFKISSSGQVTVYAYTYSDDEAFELYPNTNRSYIP